MRPARPGDGGAVFQWIGALMSRTRARSGSGNSKPRRQRTLVAGGDITGADVWAPSTGNVAGVRYFSLRYFELALRQSASRTSATSK